MTMKYCALATDYDGTLAHHGRVDPSTVAALLRARDAGLPLLLVTGRELQSLFATFDRTDLFDRIVAENGAILYTPASRTLRALAPAPPPELVARLQSMQVPLEVGHAILATVEPYEHAVLDAIRELGLEWHVTFNKGAVMALPSSVTKATGFCAALEELRLLPECTVGIGDAENDHAFLEKCGLGAAVANAIQSVKQKTRLVTRAPYGDGVIELLELILADAVPAEPSNRGSLAAKLLR